MLCLILIIIALGDVSSAVKVADYVPECAQPGVQYGATLGAVTGGLSGAAALTGTGISGSTLAACPSLALTTIAGSGGALLGGPLVPIGGLLAGAALGGLAGGSTGGYVQCKRTKEMQMDLAEQMEDYLQRHPKGYLIF